MVVHSTALQPGEKRVLSLTLGWHDPERSYLEQRVGNYYATLRNNSEDAGRELGSELENHVEAINALHR
jgi:hypothetical protein